MPDEIVVDKNKFKLIYRGNKVYIEEAGVEKLYKVDDDPVDPKDHEYVGEYAQPKSTRNRVTRKQLDKLIELIRNN